MISWQHLLLGFFVYLLFRPRSLEAAGLFFKKTAQRYREEKDQVREVPYRRLGETSIVEKDQEQGENGHD